MSFDGISAEGHSHEGTRSPAAGTKPQMVPVRFAHAHLTPSIRSVTKYSHAK